MKFSEIYNLIWANGKSKLQIMNENRAKELQYAIVVTEVKDAFIDFIKSCKEEFVLIGGIALSAYIKPRTTMDVDLLIKNTQTFELISKEVNSSFKKITGISLQHNKTHCEVEVISPETINQSEELYDAILKTSVIADFAGYEIKLVSLKYLIVLKLGRITEKNPKGFQDKADIIGIFEVYGIQDLSDCVMTDNDRKTYDSVVNEYSELKGFNDC